MPFESAQGFEKEVPRIVKLTFTNPALRTQGSNSAAGSPLKRVCAAARNAVRKGNALRITPPYRTMEQPGGHTASRARESVDASEREAAQGPR